jgi:hypothetical protein
LSEALTGARQLEKVTVHPFFEISHHSAGFKDLQPKEQFNQALIQYTVCGKYQELKDKYEFQDITPTLAKLK